MLSWRVVGATWVQKLVSRDDAVLISEIRVAPYLCAILGFWAGHHQGEALGKILGMSPPRGEEHPPEAWPIGGGREGPPLLEGGRGHHQDPRPKGDSASARGDLVGGWQHVHH